jgi:hypothetical protein
MTTGTDLDAGTAPQPSGWRPANDGERRLLAAAKADDLEEMMRVLAGVPLLLPGYRDTDPETPSSLDGPSQRLLTRARDGVPYVLAFTSPETLHRTVDADGWRVTTLTELTGGIPEGWGLAVNPATPVVVLVTPEALPTLVPTRASLARFVPANEIERLVSEALVVPDPDVALGALVISTVIVPVQALDVDGVLTVPVFTSPERYEEFLDGRQIDVPTATADLVAVLRQWPGPDYRLGINLGSPISMSLRGERVPELLRYAETLAARLHDRTPGEARSSARPVGTVVGTTAEDTDPPPDPMNHGDIGDVLRGLE